MATNQLITRAYADQNFPLKYDGVYFSFYNYNPPWPSNKVLTCDELKSVFNVFISGSSSTGQRCPNQNEVIPLCRVGDQFQGGRIGYVFNSSQSYWDGSSWYSNTASRICGIITHYDFTPSSYPWASNANNIGPTIFDQFTVGLAVSNTDRITSIVGAGTYAASVCRAQTKGGYTWHLPCCGDMTYLYVNKALAGIENAVYWTSDYHSSYPNNGVYYNMSNQNVNTALKTLQYKIMPIHYFHT